MESVNGYKVSFQVDENILILGYGDFCKTANTLKTTSLYTLFEYTFVTLGSPHSSVGKESACSAEDPGLIPGSGRSPGGGNGNPLQYSCLENPTDRSLAGYSPWGHKESDMTEQLHFTFQSKNKGQRENVTCLE